MEIPIPYTPPHVSVNRVRIVDLPGVAMDDRVRGKCAYELLSSRAIRQYAIELVEALELPPAFTSDSATARSELPHFVASGLQSGRPQSRKAAEQIADRLGRNLGHILLALHRGDDVNRDARPDWTAADWDRWARVRQVWLGGGIMSGRLGDQILEQAQAFLAENGDGTSLQIGLSRHKRDIALVGAARYLPPHDGHYVCLDLGQTLVKRACVTLDAGTINQVRDYPSLATDWDDLSEPSYSNPARGRKVLDFAVGTIAQTMDECRNDGLRPGEDVMLSVAAYVRDGRLLGNGVYAQMTALAANTERLLADTVGIRTGLTLRPRFIHDGTAAAAMHAGEPDTAVIVVGTALGVGFPPTSATGLRPLA